MIIGRLCKKLSEASLKPELTLEGYQPYLLEDIEYARIYNDARTILANPQDAYNLQVAGYFHDLGECHLDICDVITGQKNQEQKDSEDDITLQILTTAGFEGEQLAQIVSIIKKKGSVGGLLKRIEKYQFLRTSQLVQRRLLYVRELRYRSIGGKHKDIPDDLKEFWTQYATPKIEGEITSHRKLIYPEHYS